MENRFQNDIIEENSLRPYFILRAQFILRKYFHHLLVLQNENTNEKDN